MAIRCLIIRSTDDAALRERFHAFVPLTFRSVDFRRWDSRGGWDANYSAFLLLDGDEAVASVGLTQMRLSLQGRECRGYQLGAVASHPARRGQGHGRELLQQVMAHIDAAAAPALLFANDTVLDFYPLFGFRALEQRRYAVDIALQPGTKPAPLCDIATHEARERLRLLCARAGFNDAAFGARDYYGVLLWHLTYRPLRAYWLDQGSALAVVEEIEGTLWLRDLIATRPFDLAGSLPSLLQAPVVRVEFGFQPRAHWPAANDVGGYEDSPLFVRGMDALTASALRFPDLAQT